MSIGDWQRHQNLPRACHLWGICHGTSSKVFTVGDYNTTQIDHALALNALKAMKADGRAVLIIGGVKAETPQERAEGLHRKGHCHGKRLSAEQGPGVEPFHAAAVAACHCSIALALKRRSVRREMR